MRLLSLAALAVLLPTGSLTAFADSVIPYGNVGQIAPTEPITATVTGQILGYFVNASAADTDVVRMVDVTTGMTSAWFFPNQTTPQDTIEDFGSVNAGDQLVFELYNENINQLFASDPSYSSDGVNHAYSQNFAGGPLLGGYFPAGVYIGMEDLPNHHSDFDYNDDTFVFADTTLSKTYNPGDPPGATNPSAVSEPGSLLLLGTGALGAVGALRRKIFR